MKYVIVYHLYGEWDSQKQEPNTVLIELQFRTSEAPSDAMSGWYYITSGGINELLSGGERRSECAGDGSRVVLEFPGVERYDWGVCYDGVSGFVDTVLVSRFALCREDIIQVLTSILVVEVL